MNINIGTRGSLLALWQANMVAENLRKVGLTTNIITIETKGDKILDRSLASIGSKGLFTEEIEEQLINKTIDIAVHSAKDMQSTLPQGMEIIAFTEREKSNDVLVSFDKTLTLTSDKPMIIGTSSARRKAILKYHYPKIETVEIRGNLQTRIRKMQEGHCQAMILAYAGIHRMEYDDLINEILDEEIFVPPVGQGCVAIEAHSSLDKTKKEMICQALNHIETAMLVTEERKLLQNLDGGCSIPLFCKASIVNDQFEINAGLINHSKNIKIQAKISEPIISYKSCVDKVIDELENQNIHEILNDIRLNV
ncbi:MAG: hydroxymethylbilane synthase [Cytophagales bacterium]|nr:MAG: hydroxymethylbilane synthase [Cytophagales bacterium]